MSVGENWGAKSKHSERFGKSRLLNFAKSGSVRGNSQFVITLGNAVNFVMAIGGDASPDVATFALGPFVPPPSSAKMVRRNCARVRCVLLSPSWVLQEPALHLVPLKSTQSSVSIADTASSLGLHDAMRYGTRSLAADLAPKHPLQGRLDGVRHPPPSLSLLPPQLGRRRRNADAECLDTVGSDTREPRPDPPTQHVRHPRPRPPPHGATPRLPGPSLSFPPPRAQNDADLSSTCASNHQPSRSTRVSPRAPTSTSTSSSARTRPSTLPTSSPVRSSPAPCTM